MKSDSVAVLGGGPGGAFCAELLARAGLRTMVFDERLAWEKPCGGALPVKAQGRYPFLLDNAKPKARPNQITFGVSGGPQTRLRLREPMVVYAREDLNRMMLERAEAAGAEIEQARVLAVERSASGWKLTTSKGSATAGYCVVATGARNSLRRFGAKLAPPDVMMALGYYVPDTRHQAMHIEFPLEMEGYIWIFPRHNHTSVGICGKGAPSQALRREVERYMDRAGISRQGAAFYAHPIPSLTPEAWTTNRIAGDGWLAVGDAAGLVDPITGEGLYYALRSAELAAGAAIAGDGCPERWGRSYQEAVTRDFGADLATAAAIARRFYFGRFLGGPVIKRMVQFSARSPMFADVMQDLLAGNQPYLDLKPRLYRNLARTLAQIGASFLPGPRLRG
ncbi:MAG: NAD(P)/FAD-dependent oxidoreductase [Bryobacteraceae bacterium]|nr:NAD(P)/FAD-dependent oxidoreductase [Bryobacteraceae bacterium]